MADVASLHVDSALTNVSVRYRNAAFIADRVFPEVTVDKQSNKYPVYGKENLRADDDLRRPGTESNEIEWSLSHDPYYCDGHALNSVIPDEHRGNADGAIDLDMDTTENLTDKILLSREVNLVAALAAGATTVDLAAIKWDNDANDPVKKVDLERETIAKACGLAPNVLVVSRPVFRGMRNNALVKGRITGAAELRNASVSAQQLADLMDLQEVIIADAVKLTSNEGQADVLDYVWGKYALLFYRPPSPGLRTISLGYNFMWKTGNLGSLVYRGRLEKRHADYIEVMKYYDQKVVAVGAGILFANVVT
jgi:hypothetical protein